MMALIIVFFKLFFFCIYKNGTFCFGRITLNAQMLLRHAVKLFCTVKVHFKCALDFGCKRVKTNLFRVKMTYVLLKKSSST